MDVPLKDYIDAQDEKTRAQNDARFAEISAQISKVISKLDDLKDPPSIWQIAGLLLTSLGVVLGLVFAVLAFASDRFDGGIAASGLLDQFEARQSERDADHDAKLDLILEEVRSLATQPAPGSP